MRINTKHADFVNSRVLVHQMLKDGYPERVQKVNPVMFESKYKQHMEQVYEKCKKDTMLSDLLDIMSKTLDVSGVEMQHSRENQKKRFRDLKDSNSINRVVKARFALGNDDGAYLRMNIMPLQTVIDDDNLMYRLSNKMSLEMQNATFRGLLNAYETSCNDTLQRQKGVLLTVWNVVKWLLSIEEVKSFVEFEVSGDDQTDCHVSKATSVIQKAKALDYMPDFEDDESISALELIVDTLLHLFAEKVTESVKAHLDTTNASMERFRESIDRADSEALDNASADWVKAFKRQKNERFKDSIRAYEKEGYVSYALARGLCGRRAPHHQKNLDGVELLYNIPRVKCPSLSEVSDVLCYDEIGTSRCTVRDRPFIQFKIDDFCDFEGQENTSCALWSPSNRSGSTNDSTDESVSACSVIEHLVDYYKKASRGKDEREEKSNYLAHAAVAKLLQLKFMAEVFSFGERDKLCLGNGFQTIPVKTKVHTGVQTKVFYAPYAGLAKANAGNTKTNVEELEELKANILADTQRISKLEDKAKERQEANAKLRGDNAKLRGDKEELKQEIADLKSLANSYDEANKNLRSANKMMEDDKLQLQKDNVQLTEDVRRRDYQLRSTYTTINKNRDDEEQLEAMLEKLEAMLVEKTQEYDELKEQYAVVTRLSPEKIAKYEKKDAETEKQFENMTKDGVDTFGTSIGAAPGSSSVADIGADPTTADPNDPQNDTQLSELSELSVKMRKDIKVKYENLEPNIFLSGKWTDGTCEYKAPAIRSGSFSAVLPPDNTKHMVEKHAKSILETCLKLLLQRRDTIKKRVDTKNAKQKLESLNHESLDAMAEAVEKMARTRREEVWNDSMREAAIAGDRLYAFVRQLSGTIHETVDAICVVDESMLVRQQRDRQADAKRLSMMASQQQMQLVSNVFRSVINESGLTLGIDEKKGLDGELKVVSNTLRKQVSELTSGSSSSEGFFTNSVKLENLLAQGTGEITLTGLFGKLREVGLALQDAAMNDSTDPGSPMGPSLDFLSSPRNSLILRWKPESHAAIRQAFDTFQREMASRHHVMGTLGRHRKITAFELMEGRSDELTMAFATYCAHTLAHQRMFSAGQAPYLGQWAARANIAAMRFSCDKLISVACEYVTKTKRPFFVDDCGWESYFGVITAK